MQDRTPTRSLELGDTTQLTDFMKHSKIAVCLCLQQDRPGKIVVRFSACKRNNQKYLLAGGAWGTVVSVAKVFDSNGCHASDKVNRNPLSRGHSTRMASEKQKISVPPTQELSLEIRVNLRVVEKVLRVLSSSSEFPTEGARSWLKRVPMSRLSKFLYAVHPVRANVVFR